MAHWHAWRTAICEHFHFCWAHNPSDTKLLWAVGRKRVPTTNLLTDLLVKKNKPKPRVLRGFLLDPRQMVIQTLTCHSLGCSSPHLPLGSSSIRFQTPYFLRKSTASETLKCPEERVQVLVFGVSYTFIIPFLGHFET